MMNLSPRWGVPAMDGACLWGLSIKPLLGAIFTFFLCFLDIPLLLAQTSMASDSRAGEAESSFFEALQNGNATQAEIILEEILKKKPAGGSADQGLAHLMFSLGNFYSESGKISEARKWYEKLEQDHGNQFADEENQITFKSILAPKIAWLKGGGKRSWAASDPLQLAERIAAALGKSEPKLLEDLLAQVDTYVGWWASEYEPTSREALIEHISKFRGPAITWVNQDDFKKASKSGEKILYLNTHGWKEMEGFQNIQFAIHSTAEGWEWRGIVLGESK